MGNGHYQKFNITSFDLNAMYTEWRYPLHSWIQLTLFSFCWRFLKKNKARNITVAVYPIDPASANMSSVIFAGDYATKYENTFIDLFFMQFLTTMTRLLNLPWLVMPPWPFVFDIWPLNLKSIPTLFVIKSFCKVLFHIARWLQIGIIYHTKPNITHMTR